MFKFFTLDFLQFNQVAIVFIFFTKLEIKLTK